MATKSISAFASFAARMTWRPMRPNPLMPTFNVMGELASGSFVRPRIQPDARPRLGFVGPYHLQNRSIVPPYRRREKGELAEDARIQQARLQGDEAPQRGAADAVVRGRPACAVLAVDEGLEFLRQHLGVTIALAAFSAAGVLGGRG